MARRGHPNRRRSRQDGPELFPKPQACRLREVTTTDIEIIEARNVSVAWAMALSGAAESDLGSGESWGNQGATPRSLLMT